MVQKSTVRIKDALQGTEPRNAWVDADPNTAFGFHMAAFNAMIHEAH